MHKFSLGGWLVLMIALVGVSGTARSVDGYLRLPVPDLPQAVEFFHNVLNCAPIGDGTASGDAPVALMDCGEGEIVELSVRTVAAHTHAQPHPASAPAMALATHNAIAVAGWLRANHVTVVGPPQRMVDDMGAGHVVVTFLAPWGQRMQLVSDASTASDPPEAAVAAKRVAVH